LSSAELVADEQWKGKEAEKEKEEKKKKKRGELATLKSGQVSR